MSCICLSSSFNSVEAKRTSLLHVLHNRLGHPSMSKMKYVSSCNTNVDTSSSSIFTHTFELLHVYLWGPYGVALLLGAKYFLTLVYDKSKCTWTYLLIHKSQTIYIPAQFLSYINNHFGVTPKYIRSKLVFIS